MSLTLGEDRLQQYLALADGCAGGKAAVSVIRQATADPHLYVFGELLNHPTLLKLKNSDEKSTYDLLEIFAYGTYKTYAESMNDYPELNLAEKSKLRKLSIVSYGAGKQKISYNTLLKELHLDTIRELEDLIIESIYAGLIQGRLDQKNGMLDVDFTFGRDVSESDIDSLLVNMEAWKIRTVKLIQDLDAQASYLVQSQEQATKRQADFAALVEKNRKQIQRMCHTSSSSNTQGDLDDDQTDYQSSLIQRTEKRKKSKNSGPLPKVLTGEPNSKSTGRRR